MPVRLSLLLLTLAAPLAAHAQSLCTSDRQPRPVAVLERFINADCETCWQDKASPAAGKGEVAIDWVVPGGKGEDAALSAVASRDALERLEALGRKVPLAADSARSKVAAPQPRLRVVQGVAFNDYIGTSIDLAPARQARRDAWLLLVEALPAGTEGSPVARNLVRNVFRTEAGSARLEETRAMQIHEGTQPARLRLVALVHDAAGRLVAAARTSCE